MLSKQRRINRRLYPSTKPLRSARGQFLSVSLFPREGNSRFSFSISKKVAKSAVERNKMRRLGYRTIAKNLKEIKNNFLIRFSIHKISSLPQDLKKDIENLLIKTGIIDK